MSVLGPDGFLCARKRADLLAVGPHDKSLLDVDVLANVFYSLEVGEGLLEHRKRPIR